MSSLPSEEEIARALHEAHKPWCDYTYPFEHPMSGRKVYETLARAVLVLLSESALTHSKGQDVS